MFAFLKIIKLSFKRFLLTFPLQRREEREKERNSNVRRKKRFLASHTQTTGIPDCNPACALTSNPTGDLPVCRTQPQQSGLKICFWNSLLNVTSTTTQKSKDKETGLRQMKKLFHRIALNIMKWKGSHDQYGWEGWASSLKARGGLLHYQTGPMSGLGVQSPMGAGERGEGATFLSHITVFLPPFSSI